MASLPLVRARASGVWPRLFFISGSAPWATRNAMMASDPRPEMATWSAVSPASFVAWISKPSAKQETDGLHGFFVAPLIVGRRSGAAVAPAQSGGEQQRVGAVRHGDFRVRSSGHQSAHHFNVAGLCRAKERRRAFAQRRIAGCVMALHNGLLQPEVRIRATWRATSSRDRRRSSVPTGFGLGLPCPTARRCMSATA